MEYPVKWHKDLVQGSDAWHALRAGRFGASGIKSILSKPRAKKDADQLSEGGKTKAQEKAFQSFLGESYDSSFSSAATDWGNEWESKARETYEEEYLTTVSEVGYIEFGQHAGVSPDGVLFDEKKLIEIKCPFNPEKHLENCLYITDNESFKKLRPEYYYQVQFQLLVSGFESCDFVSFDPRMAEIKPSLVLKVVNITPDQEAFDLIRERLGKAIQYKLNLIETLNAL